MTEEPHENRFERNRKAVYAVAFSLAGLVQLGLALLTVKIVRDDEFADNRSMAQKFKPEAVTRSYRLNLEHFIFLCRQHGITPVFMTQFNRYTETPDDNWRRQLKPMFDNWHITYEQYRASYMALNDAMRDVAREQNVQLIDLDRLVPKTKDYMYDVVHLNANGSRFVADVVSKSLDPVLR